MAYNNRGIAWSRQGEINRAINDFTKTIELNPDAAEAYISRANAYLILMQNKKAITDFNTLILHQIDLEK